MDRRLLLDWMRLVRVPGLGPVGISRLLEHFGGPEDVLRATPQALAGVPGIRARLLEVMLRFRRETDTAPFAYELDRLVTLGGRMLVRNSPDYPPLLETIHDPPPILFALGDPVHLSSKAVAVVGSRFASRAGIAFARRLGMDLARQGLTTVSGLAVGIDAAAHQGALEGGGPTVAVLATGLDVDYPIPNLALKRNIAVNGCLVTEAPLGTAPAAYLFPPRNRIISGLCQGVTVVEAAPRSGSLITARLALEEGREVFAVPGPVDDDRSRGVHKLLRQGARLVEGVDDIMEELAWPMRPLPEPAAPKKVAATPVHPPLRAEAADMLTQLQQGTMHGDELARRCHMSVSMLAPFLLQLELAGLVERLPGNHYTLRRR